jgi:phosphoribosylformimino-5-aminoimidazole carboxamide ribonucleotide (ProFAR) isomerase
MPFAVLPAIDVTGGVAGVFTPLGPRPLEGPPVAPGDIAARFAAAGARWVHVVDMDLAFGGLPEPSIVEAVAASAPDVSIQASGGIRRPEHARVFLDAGAARVVVGSAALGDRTAMEATMAACGGRFVVGIEVGDGRIVSRGADPVDLDLMPTVGWLAAAGVPGFLVTATERVGERSGPDLAVIRRVARSAVPVIAAGGIASIEDLRAAREAGAVGAIVGTAAIEGSLDLAEALRWART